MSGMGFKILSREEKEIDFACGKIFLLAESG